VVLHSFYIRIIPITLIFSLYWEVWPKTKLAAQLAWTRPYKSRIENKHGENVIFKYRE